MRVAWCWEMTHFPTLPFCTGFDAIVMGLEVSSSQVRVSLSPRSPALTKCFSHLFTDSHTRGALLAVCVSCRISNVAKKDNSADNAAREVEFGLPDGGENGEQNAVFV